MKSPETRISDFYGKFLSPLLVLQVKTMCLYQGIKTCPLVLSLTSLFYFILQLRNFYLNELPSSFLTISDNWTVPALIISPMHLPSSAIIYNINCLFFLLLSSLVFLLRRLFWLVMLCDRQSTCYHVWLVKKHTWTPQTLSELFSCGDL